MKGAAAARAILAFAGRKSARRYLFPGFEAGSKKECILELLLGFGSTRNIVGISVLGLASLAGCNLGIGICTMNFRKSSWRIILSRKSGLTGSAGISIVLGNP